LSAHNRRFCRRYVGIRRLWTCFFPQTTVGSYGGFRAVCGRCGLLVGVSFVDDQRIFSWGRARCEIPTGPTATSNDAYSAEYSVTTDRSRSESLPPELVDRRSAVCGSHKCSAATVPWVTVVLRHRNILPVVARWHSLLIHYVVDVLSGTAVKPVRPDNPTCGAG